jgi:hypothetical protein
VDLERAVVGAGGAAVPGQAGEQAGEFGQVCQK